MTVSLFQPTRDLSHYTLKRLPRLKGVGDL